MYIDCDVVTCVHSDEGGSVAMRRRRGEWQLGKRCDCLRACCPPPTTTTVQLDYTPPQPRSTAMPPLVQLSEESKAKCFNDLDALCFNMDGMYPRP